MRDTASSNGLTAMAVAGTNVVMLGWDMPASQIQAEDILGFSIRRKRASDQEVRWMTGMKTFQSVTPNPAPGVPVSTHKHPVQSFQWADFSVSPGQTYTYRIVARRAPAPALTNGSEVTLTVTTEAIDVGPHAIFFNRGAVASQEYARRFQNQRPDAVGQAAFDWLSRGLLEGLEAFILTAGAGSELFGAFFEFKNERVYKALKAAKARGAQIKILYDGDSQSEKNEEALENSGIKGLTKPREHSGNYAHNKFLVLRHNGTAVAVWTGSTNLTQGAIFGHLNVGHLIGDPAVGQRFLDYWAQLADQTLTTAKLRLWTESTNPVDLAAPGIATIFSPRATTSSLLDGYAGAFDGGISSAHITGAFGLNKVFRQRLGVDRDVVRTVLLDQEPDAGQEIPTVDLDVRVSWGDYLRKVTFEQWADEHLTNFNSWVKFIHTKIIMIDPLAPASVTLTGSANYSDNSTTDNEENTVVIRGDGTAAGDAAARRVADVYLTEYQRLFMHFVFRDWAAKDAETGEGGGFLAEDDSWTARYYEPGGWRARQRATFASPVA